MPQTARFQERIGTVFLPEAAVVQPPDQVTGPRVAVDGDQGDLGGPYIPTPDWRLCHVNLKPGCYALSFVTTRTKFVIPRYQGTLRVEQLAGGGMRLSADLYVDWGAIRLQVPPVIGHDGPVPDDAGAGEVARGEVVPDVAGDTGAAIPIYPRRDYRAYLKGTGIRLLSFVPRGAPCTFDLDFEQFDYKHPATGFKGGFDPVPTRKIKYALHATGTPDVYEGKVYDGSTVLGTASIRWISPFYRRAEVRLSTLEGAQPPPAELDGETFATTFAKAGWDLTVVDDGTVPLPPELEGTDIGACWPEERLHRLMTSLPGYDPAKLDTVWRVHLLAVPATLGCGRGVMFDSSLGADPDEVAREGAATFSDDGYPAGDCPDGQGGSHYDAVADMLQRQVPRAFLRSATHEIGHAFNQIHTFFEAPIDNSIMSPTPSVATAIGLAGKFPDEVALAFNTLVTGHLDHLPDPAVRPGAMDFFGSAVAAPQATDVDWPHDLELVVTPAKSQVTLGEPLALTWELTGRGTPARPVPLTLDVPSLTARVSVTDPRDVITFMRPADIESCPTIRLEPLRPGESRSGSTTLFWGTDGFAFTTPGYHRVEVIVLWRVGGVPVAVSGTSDVFVAYPTTAGDNDVTALLLNAEVGKAVALGVPYAEAVRRIGLAREIAPAHPANEMIRRLGLGG
ncbi:hypothetical protein [Streptosporangium sp. NPDC051022]|uniref:hypothetical protein n=1 Tax=Streptosporangium sp. NPDC051022 TaxID=3155752 RepID=UPI0034159452